MLAEKNQAKMNSRLKILQKSLVLSKLQQKFSDRGPPAQA